LSQDIAAPENAYEQFLMLWKDADGRPPAADRRAARARGFADLRIYELTDSTHHVFAILDWGEHTGPSLWVREDPTIFAFPLMLILHTVGMAFLVGSNVALDARILGVGRGVALTSMLPFFRVMWFGFWLNLLSGLGLLLAYPTKALTNPVFYLKLTLIAAGSCRRSGFAATFSTTRGWATTGRRVRCDCARCSRSSAG
jgi:hypothetical protein